MTRTIDIPDELAKTLRELADIEHRSVSKTIIVAIEEYVDRNKQRAQVRASAARIIKQDEELLKRLADR